MHLSLPSTCATIALFTLVYVTPIHSFPLQLLPRAGIAVNSSTAIKPFSSLCSNLEVGQQQRRCNDFVVRVQEGILAAAPICKQQDGADQLIDLAHSLHSTALVKLARLWMQQPRGNTYSLSVPYCDKPPRNPELQGLYQCQFAGVDPKNFATTQGGTPTPVGAKTTIPFGAVGPVNPPGSCPDHPDGPIPNSAVFTCLVLQREAQLESSGGEDDEEDGDSDSDDHDDDDDDEDADDDDNSRRRRRLGRGARGRKGGIRSADLLKLCRNLSK